MPVSKRFLDLLGAMEDIHRRKNAGYAGENSEDPWANFRMAERLGITPLKGCLVRMGDKYIRACNIIQDPDNEQVGEKLTDTLIDLANYCLIAVCLFEESEYDENLDEDFDEESDCNISNVPNKPETPISVIIEQAFSDGQEAINDFAMAVTNLVNKIFIGRHVIIISNVMPVAGIVTNVIDGRAIVRVDNKDYTMNVPIDNLVIIE